MSSTVLLLSERQSVSQPFFFRITGSRMRVLQRSLTVFLMVSNQLKVKVIHGKYYSRYLCVLFPEYASAFRLA